MRDREGEKGWQTERGRYCHSGNSRDLYRSRPLTLLVLVVTNLGTFRHDPNAAKSLIMQQHEGDEKNQVPCFVFTQVNQVNTICKFSFRVFSQLIIDTTLHRERNQSPWKPTATELEVTIL